MKIYPFILSICLMLFLGCSSDDDSNSSSSSASANTNANTQQPTNRMEFPHLDGSQCKVLVHKDGSEINYSIEWDINKNAQRWTCYELYRSNLTQGKGVKRYSPDDYHLKYLPDPLLPSLTDLIKGSGYEHGHIIPSADRLNTTAQNVQTFYYTNMMPQLPNFNSGVWGNMEKAVRNFARSANYTTCDTLYVCRGGTIGAGGTLKKQVIKTQSNGLIVPAYYFCALLMVKNGQYHAIGLLFQHEANTDGNLAKYCRSIDQLEEETGIDFFCNLPDNREKVIEATYLPSIWNFN